MLNNRTTNENMQKQIEIHVVQKWMKN